MLVSSWEETEQEAEGRLHRELEVPEAKAVVVSEDRVVSCAKVGLVGSLPNHSWVVVGTVSPCLRLFSAAPPHPD